MRMQIVLSWTRRPAAIVMIMLMTFLQTYAQSDSESSLRQSIEGLQKQMTEMESLMQEMKAELVRSQTELLQLRQALQASGGRLAAASDALPVDHDFELIQNLEEQQLLKAKVEEQYQTKVESASKYRVRLSGMALVNLFSNRGTVDNLDFPTLAQDDGPLNRRGSFGGSFRQSQFGLEVFGPLVRGARVSADAQFDFAGGFPNVPDGVTLGLPRLRTGGIRLAWPKTTFVAGQDVPFFSPLAPTSIASVAVPAFAYSGNLWTWTPQVRVEHSIDLPADSNLLLQGGILDPLTGETPSSQFFRIPQAGEASRQPAYAMRVAWNRGTPGHQSTIAIGGYYGQHDWGFRRNVNTWAGTTDWIIPAGSRWEFSGEFYRGQALGGLGGGIGRSALFSGPLTDPATRVKGLNAIGGWAQIKFRQTERLEWNGAFGQDNAFAKDLRAFPIVQQSYFEESVARNRAALVNFIYRLRSDLLFSLEYRRLRTFVLSGDSEKADQINLSIGVLF